MLKSVMGVLMLLGLVAGCAGNGGDVQLGAIVPSEEGLQTLVAQSALTGVVGHGIDARGAFSCDFGLDMAKFVEPLGVEIERDRIFLQKETLQQTVPKNPGMIQKHIPFTPTGPTTAFAGGRYLFQSRVQAATYATYIKQAYTYPGTTQFLERPEFSSPECRDWTVLVAWNFQSVNVHTAMRTERFDSGRSNIAQELALSVKLLQLAPALLVEAHSRGYAEMHLLQNLVDHKVQLVYFVPRMSGPDATQPDVVALGKISTDPVLGASLVSSAGVTRVFDRSALVLTVWQPFAAGDHGTPSLWPNSPPIPAPACGDNLCTPSRGETGASCPADCTPNCGDSVCQPDEDLNRCPSDCGHPFL